MISFAQTKDKRQLCFWLYFWNGLFFFSILLFFIYIYFFLVWLGTSGLLFTSVFTLTLE